MEEYNLLVSQGNIGFYKSCEVIEMYLYDKNTGKDYNLFTILVFKENYHTPIKDVTPQLIKITDNIKLGIKQYILTMNMVQKNYKNLIKGKWISNHDFNDISNTDYTFLKKMTKEYVPCNDYVILNKILKNNFFNGSYILEFFDEKKNFNCILEDEEKFKTICKTIKELTNIDLYSVKDRLGNFIFQFPINLLETHQQFDISSNYVILDFTWHDKVVKYPNCLIQIESSIDNNCVEYQIQEYNKKETQHLPINNNVPYAIRIYRKDINLLLYYTEQNSLKISFSIPNIRNLKNRTFKINEKEYKIPLLNSSKSNTKNYINFIENSTNLEESNKLEKELILKKYPVKIENKNSKMQNPLDDIRILIEKYGYRGTYIWDPFIRCDDVLNTLFHSPWYNAPLKALGTPNHQTINTLNIEYINDNENESKTNSNDNLTIHQTELKKEFEKIESNFEGLNFEYRADNEGNSHDRFIIFPGDLKNYIEPQAYSLGISINQYGKKHHILQKVLYPQQIIDEFEKKWKKGVTIWKYQK